MVRLNNSTNAVNVVLIYAALAGLWILVSDKVVESLFDSPATITLASMLKGWLFVAVTSVLLWFLIRNRDGSEKPATPPIGVAPWLTFLALAVAIVALAALGIAHTVSHQSDKEVARLQAVADLKSRQIADWLAERDNDAAFIRSSTHYAEQYRRWREGDRQSGAALHGRLVQFRGSSRFTGVMLVHPDGSLAWSDADAAGRLESPLTEAVRQAQRDGAVQRIGPYLDSAGRMHLDFVVPLAGASPLAPVIVLHADPETWLNPTLKAWPVPSASADTVLVRRDGNDVLFLNELRFRHGTAGRMRVPLAGNRILAAQVLRGEAREGDVITGVDYRGVPSIGVVRGIVGSDWLMVVKIDQEELYADALRDSAWIILAAVLALFMAGGAVLLTRQRMQLAVAEGMHQAQAEKLRALKLIDTIAETTDDAIFAKDAQGRYILFNRGAERMTGVPAAAALGRDDRSLFPSEVVDKIQAIDREVLATEQPRRYEETIPAPGGSVVIDTTKVPLRDEDGKVIGLFGIAHDISERKRAELALRESEERLSILIDHAPAALAMFDRDMRYLAVSRRWKTDFGLGERDIIGHCHYEVFPEIGETLKAIHQRGLAGEVVRGDEDRFERPDGRVQWLHWEMRPWHGADGGIGGIVIFSENITARKQAEEALRQRNNDLERLSRLTIGRELDMIELKKRINALSKELGREPPFLLAFEEDPQS